MRAGAKGCLIRLALRSPSRLRDPSLVLLLVDKWGAPGGNARPDCGIRLPKLIFGAGVLQRSAMFCNVLRGQMRGNSLYIIDSKTFYAKAGELGLRLKVA